MSFQEYVDWIYGCGVDLCDLSDEDAILLEEEYNKWRAEHD